MLVTGVYRRGGDWRVEGEVTGVERIVEVDMAASEAPPAIGARLGLRIENAKLFTPRADADGGDNRTSRAAR